MHLICRPQFKAIQVGTSDENGSPLPENRATSSAKPRPNRDEDQQQVILRVNLLANLF